MITVSTPAQRLACLRREDEEQRLRRRDQHVGRPLREAAAHVLRGVAGPDADLDVRHLDADPLGASADPGERGAQVALDVDREGLQRRYVEHATASEGGLGRRRARDPVERPQERGERLAGPGRRDDEGVASGRTASHAPTWAGVGPAKASANHVRVAGLNRPSTASASG